MPRDDGISDDDANDISSIEESSIEELKELATLSGMERPTSCFFVILSRFTLGSESELQRR